MKAVALALLSSLAVTACSGGQPQPTSSGSALVESCPPVDITGPDGKPIDLSGPWSANDGGIYYLKQVDSCLWWSGLSDFEGEDPGQSWVMTFKGRIGADQVIHGDFVDVKSDNAGTGTITIRIDARQDNGQTSVYLNRTEATGHAIGVTFWQRLRVEPAPTFSLPPETLPPS